MLEEMPRFPVEYLKAVKRGAGDTCNHPNQGYTFSFAFLYLLWMLAVAIRVSCCDH